MTYVCQATNMMSVHAKLGRNAQNLLSPANGNQLQPVCLGGLPRNRCQNGTRRARDLLGEMPVKDKRERSRKRQREDSDWNKNLTAVKERWEEGLVKNGLRLHTV